MPGRGTGRRPASAGHPTLTGAVAAYRHYTARVWLIRADNDDLYEETIVPGVSELPDWAINEVLNEAESGKR